MTVFNEDKLRDTPIFKQFKLNTMETTQILDKISSEMDNVSAIRERLFSVVDIQVPKPPIKNVDSEDIDEPDTKIIYNSKGRFLGHVGRVYESLQPSQFLDSLLGTIEGCETDANLDLSKLEYRELKEGRVIEFRLPLDIVSFKNSKGKQDETNLFLNFWTGFGGTSRTEIGLYSKRLICSNGMRIIQSETELNVKHTVNMNAKVLLYCEQLMKTIAKVQETSKVWQQMDSVQVNSDTVKMFAEKIAGVTKEEKQTGKLSTRKANILNQVNEAIAQEFQRTGATVWGLLNGATNYTNHFASGSQDEDYILVNTGAKVNELAQREAIALLN